jgi:hypothetical protein
MFDSSTYLIKFRSKRLRQNSSAGPEGIILRVLAMHFVHVFSTLLPTQIQKKPYRAFLYLQGLVEGVRTYLAPLPYVKLT